MTIQPGDKIPSVTLKHLTQDGMAEITTDEIFAGRKIVMFAVPGAFTPTCSARHLPGYLDRLDDFKAKGVDEVVCMAVNDPFVMKAWGEKTEVNGAIRLLPDGNGDLTRKLGLEMDGTAHGLGSRVKRFALVAEDGRVTKIAVEDGPGVTVSGADAILESL